MTGNRRSTRRCWYVMILAAVFALQPAATVFAGVYVDLPTRLWPGGVIPYEVDAADPPNANSLLVLVAAMNIWSAAANVQFVPRNGQAYYLRIRTGTTGPSYPPPVGYRGSGGHILNINNWGSNPNDVNNCLLVFGLCHEVGHVLGLMHTHQSNNRNAYFIVDTTRLAAGTASGDWNIIPDSLEWPPNQADIDSIMSYPLCTAAACANCGANLNACAPILLREPYATAWAAQLTCSGMAQCPPPVSCVGQRNHLSNFDMKLMSYLYPQPNWRFANPASTASLETGIFHYPAKTYGVGETLTPVGGTLWLEPATYSAAGVHTKQMVLRATRTGGAGIH